MKNLFPATKLWRFVSLIFCLGIILITVIGCGSSVPAATPTPLPSPTPTPDPADIARDAGATMSGLDSVQFDIVRTGGPAFVDQDGLFAINQATGAYQAPQSAVAALDVAGPGLNIKVETIAIGEEQWLTNFLTGQWEKLPAGFGFNPAIIFSEEVGLEPILAENLVSADPPRTETLDGTEYQVLDVAIEGDRVSAITAGTTQSGEAVPLELWIDPTTQYIHRIVFETPSKTDEPSQWTINFTAFNEEVVIEAPQ